MKSGPKAICAGAVALAALLLGAAPDARAQNADPKLLLNACVTCHGPGGRSSGAMPSIYGRTEAALAETLRAFRADQRPGTTVMNRLSKGYTDAEINAIAREVSANWK